MLKFLFLWAAMLLSSAVWSQVPSTALITRTTGPNEVMGQVLVPSVPRPAGKTTQQASFMFKTTNYLMNSAYPFMPSSYHMGVILRTHGQFATGTGPTDVQWIIGRGIIIGNTHRVAENLGDPHCNQTATSQIEVFGGSYGGNTWGGSLYE